jgi:hypothetical protein
MSVIYRDYENVKKVLSQDLKFDNYELYRISLIYPHEDILNLLFCQSAIKNNINELFTIFDHKIEFPRSIKLIKCLSQNEFILPYYLHLINKPRITLKKNLKTKSWYHQRIEYFNLFKDLIDDNDDTIITNIDEFFRQSIINLEINFVFLFRDHITESFILSKYDIEKIHENKIMYNNMLCNEHTYDFRAIKDTINESYNEIIQALCYE